MLAFCWLVCNQTSGQTLRYTSTDPANKRVASYEGFDYYSSTFRQAAGVGQPPSSIDVGPVNTLDDPGPPASSSKYGVRQTLAATPMLAAIPLNNVNTTNNERTNSRYALGWAGDWVGNTGYLVSNQVANTTINSPKPTETFSLVNVGFYAVGGGGSTGVGRRLQTSTASYFYEYEIFEEVDQNNNTFDVAYTDEFYFRGGVGAGNNNDERFSRTLPVSPIRHNDGSRAHHRRSNGTATHTMATSLGASGSTLWFGFLMRINSRDINNATIANKNQDAFVRLHEDGNPADIDLFSKIAIGTLPNTDAAAFGTGSTRKWGMYIDGNPYVANGSAPTDSSLIKEDQFTLLVTSMEFQATQTVVKLYVINNNSRYYNSGTVDVISDGIPGTIDIPNDPVAIATIPSSTDLSFHSLSYFGGGTLGYSNIDELRFGRTYDMAALATQTIAVLRDLCESDLDGDGLPDGTAGFNVNTGGDLGTIETTDVSTPTGGEILGSGGAYNTVYEPVSAAPFPVIAPLMPASDNPSPATINTAVGIGSFTDTNSPTARVMFEAPGTAFGGGTYGTIAAPTFLYNFNAGGQPNDGSYYVGNQSRSPFGGANVQIDINGNGTIDAGESFFQPIWIRAYDNSGDQLGNMMVVNAAYSRGKFFEQTVSNICSGTQYEFYCDILNLFNSNTKSITNFSRHSSDPSLVNYECSYDNANEPGASQFAFPGTDLNGNSGLGAATRGQGSTCGGLNPEIEILLDDVPVYIPPISIANDESWHRIGFTFVTKNIPSGQIKISVRNRAPGGNGNDLAIDNFIFRPCGPSLERARAGVCVDPSDPAAAVAQYNVKGKTFRRPFYKWKLRPCTANCTAGNPAARTYGPEITMFSNSVGNNGGAFFDANDAAIRIDSMNSVNTPALTALLAANGGQIPVGSVIYVLSASENGGNTDTPSCRIEGEPISVTCLVPLPVTLVSFKVALVNGTVKLDWKTVDEKNFREFIIERSADGISFAPIGTLPSKANGGTIRTYTQIDYQPLEGTSYYRLQMVDTDGKFQYSNIESVRIQAAYAIYPIPTDKELMVSLVEKNTKTRNVQVDIYSTLGNILMSGEYILSPGNREISVPVSGLKPGVYITRVTDGEVVVSKRIVISR